MFFLLVANNILACFFITAYYKQYSPLQYNVIGVKINHKYKNINSLDKLISLCILIVEIVL